VSRRQAAYNGVTGFVGPPGSGKTYSMTERLVQRLLEGWRVFTNAGFEVVIHKDACKYPETVSAYHDERRRERQERLPRRARRPHSCDCTPRSERLFSVEEAMTVPDGSAVGFDEFQMAVNSRKSSEFPRGLLYRVSQVRKDDIELYWSSQREMAVDVNIRGVTFFVQRCRRLGRLPLFIRSTWPPIDHVKSDDRPLASKLYRIKRQVFRAYDTFAKVYAAPETVESLISDVVKPWVPMTEDLTDALLSRDVDRARELLELYQADGRRSVEERRSTKSLDDVDDPEDAGSGGMWVLEGDEISWRGAPVGAG
jgi:hypothetical protein